MLAAANLIWLGSTVALSGQMFFGFFCGSQSLW